MLIVIVRKHPLPYNEDISLAVSLCCFFENCDKVDNDNEGRHKQAQIYVSSALFSGAPATDIYDYF
jgi:DNA-binding XRE family transcriptional regulator